jgi:cell shape-determining protein MreC
LVFVLAGTGHLLTGTADFFQTKHSLQLENTRLRQENLRLRNIWLADHLVETENQELKKLVGLRDKKRIPLVVPILIKPNQTTNDILLIETSDLPAGTILHSGDHVVTGGGTVLLGEVTEVFANSAKIRLYSSFGEQVAVTIGAEHIPAIALGQGVGNFYLSLPKGVNVKEGDPVTASAYHDLLLGSVGTIESKSSSPYITVRFRIPINLYELKWVEIYAD